MADHVAAWLEAAGLDVSRHEAAPGRPNVVGTRRGTSGGRSLMLNAHMDTVGIGGSADGIRPRTEAGRMYGRGAYDMKAGLAIAMVAAAAVPPLRGDVIVAAVCDEELAGIGTAAVLEHLRPDAAIVTEPTELAAGVAHKGFQGFAIATTGRAAHGSRPDLGEDAILAMGPVLHELRALEGRLSQAPPHPLLGRASLHASLIDGGQEFSSYPARCELIGELRTLPGGGDAMALVRDAVRRSGAPATVEARWSGEPFAVDPAHELVELVVRHGASERTGLPFWTDAAQLAAAGVPTVLFGPAGGGAHGDVEWVDLASVHHVCDTLVAVARDFCGVAETPARRRRAGAADRRRCAAPSR